MIACNKAPICCAVPDTRTPRNEISAAGARKRASCLAWQVWPGRLPYAAAMIVLTLSAIFSAESCAISKSLLRPPFSKKYRSGSVSR